jgi:hypothetical protein
LGALLRETGLGRDEKKDTCCAAEQGLNSS